MLTGKTDGWNPAWARRLHWPMFAGFCGSIVLDLWVTSENLESRKALGAFHSLPWAMAGLSLGVGLARQLPVQNVVMAAMGCISLTASASLLLALTGNLDTGGVLALKLFRSALVWLTVSIVSIGTARFLLRPLLGGANRGFGVLGMAMFLMVSLLSQICGCFGPHEASGLSEPPPEDLLGVQIGWMSALTATFVSLAHLAFMVPLLQSKRPTREPADSHPLVVLIAGFLWLISNRYFLPSAR